jgi:hypothetical protein
MWLLAAILLSVVTAMATAVAMKQKGEDSKSGVPGVTDPKCLPADAGGAGAGAQTPASRTDSPPKKKERDRNK